MKRRGVDIVCHEKYGDIDEPCIILCDAINKLTGLETTYSCCGHGKDGFLIFIRPKNVNDFSKLLYILHKAHRIYSMPLWKVELVVRTEDSPVAFMLYSESIGEKAYRESKDIVECIEKYLQPIGTDKDFDAKWNTI